MIPFLAKVVGGLIFAKVCTDAVVYATTDQKNEGYERAIKATNKIYLSIINNVY